MSHLRWFPTITFNSYYNGIATAIHMHIHTHTHVTKGSYVASNIHKNYSLHSAKYLDGQRVTDPVTTYWN